MALLVSGYCFLEQLPPSNGVLPGGEKRNPHLQGVLLTSTLWLPTGELQRVLPGVLGPACWEHLSPGLQW